MTEGCITPLRRRMIEDMSVRHFASKTQHDYIRTVMKQGLRRDDDHDRGRSQTPGRADRRDLRTAHLGIGAHPPSAWST